MHRQRRNVLRAATRRARRAKRTTGRILVSALGFGLAYYFDTENGPARRRRLGDRLRETAGKIDGLFAPDGAPEGAPPVFHPLVQSRPEHPTILRQPQSKTG
jgi:hypothetical protein